MLWNFGIVFSVDVFDVVVLVKELILRLQIMESILKQAI